MSCLLTCTGQLLVNPGGDCGCSGSASSVSATAKALSLNAATGYYASMTDTPCAANIATATGEFVPLPAVAVGQAVSLLYLNTDLGVVLRLGGAVPSLESSGVAFPVTLGAPATLAFTVDGAAVSVSLPAATYSAQDIVNRVNSAAALVGFAFQPGTLNAETGKPVISGSKTGIDKSVVITTGAVGFTTGQSSLGAGADVKVQGIFMSQFSTPYTRIEISGTARVDVLAAG
jgi:hypothetical protein